MQKSRVVKKTIKRIDLGDGDWVEFRTSIDFGEFIGLMEIDQKPEITISQKNAAILMGTLSDWNLIDEEGRKLEINEANINSLEPMFAGELIQKAGEIIAEIAQKAADKKKLKKSVDPLPIPKSPDSVIDSTPNMS